MKRLICIIALLTSLAVAATAKNQISLSKRNSISLSYNSISIEGFEDKTSKLTASKSFLTSSLFAVASIEKTAYYNLQKEGITTTYTLTKEELPGAVLKSLNKKYKEYSIEEIVVYEDNQPASDLYAKITSDAVDKMYFVHLKNETKEFVLRITPTGSIYFFKKL